MKVWSSQKRDWGYKFWEGLGLKAKIEGSRLRVWKRRINRSKKLIAFSVAFSLSTKINLPLNFDLKEVLNILSNFFFFNTALLSYLTRVIAVFWEKLFAYLFRIPQLWACDYLQRFFYSRWASPPLWA